MGTRTSSGSKNSDFVQRRSEPARRGARAQLPATSAGQCAWAT